MPPRREPARAIFARAAERGEIRTGVDVDAALDLLYGPFDHRILNGHAPLNDRFTRTIIDSVVVAVAADGLDRPEAAAAFLLAGRPPASSAARSARASALPDYPGMLAIIRNI